MEKSLPLTDNVNNLEEAEACSLFNELVKAIPALKKFRHRVKYKITKDEQVHLSFNGIPQGIKDDTLRVYKP